MKIPWVKRKEYERVLDDRSFKTSQIVNLQRDLDAADKLISEALPRLVKIAQYEDRHFQTHRICVDFHREMVERCFTHGSDEQAISYLARHISHEIERKMIQFNFARCEFKEGGEK